MRAFTSHLKRCLALLLAVVLMVPAMSFAAFAAEECDDPEHVGCQVKTLAELIVENYGTLITDPNKPLTAAAKAVLTSGALTNDVEYHVDSVLGTGNVELDVGDATETVTAKVKPVDEGNWIPVSAGVYVGGARTKDVTLTKNGDVYTGTFDVIKEAHYVQVEYELQTEVDPAAVLALLNVAAYLKEDLVALDTLVSDPSIAIELGGVTTERTPLSVLNLLTDKEVGSYMGLSEYGTIVGLLYAISEGDLNKTVQLPEGFEFDYDDGDDDNSKYSMEISMTNAANAAATNLYNQQVANGGKLDLTQFFADHSSLSYLEIVAEHNYELDKLLGYRKTSATGDALYFDLYRIKEGLPDAVYGLKDHVAVLQHELVPAAVLWINNTVLPGLTAAGVTGLPAEGIESLDELADIVNTLQARRVGVINMVNKQLTALAAAGISVDTVSTGNNAVAEMTTLKTQLQNIPAAAAAVAALDNAIAVVTAIDGTVGGLTDAMGINDMIAKLDNMATVLEGLAEMFSALYDALKDIVVYKGNVKVTAATEAEYDSNWKSDDYIVSGTFSDVYSSINTALNAAASESVFGYEAEEIVSNTVVLDTATDKADVNMSNLTIVVKLNVLDGTNNTVTSTEKTVVILPDGTVYDDPDSENDLKSAIDGFVATALDGWKDAGHYAEGKYQPTSSEIPDELDGDCTVTITYDPVKFTVTYDYDDENVDYAYGTTVKLPAHANAAMVWDYLVGGEHYVQGQSFKVTENVTVTREEGVAYTEDKIFPMVEKQFETYLKNDSTALTRIKNIINSGSLGLEDTTLYVRYPTGGQVEIDTTGNEDEYKVTAQPYDAAYQKGAAVWKPVSLTVYEKDGENVTSRKIDAGEPVDGEYVFTFISATLDHVEVNYSVDIDGAALAGNGMETTTAVLVKTTMNEIMEVYNDVWDQLNDMDTLVKGKSGLEYLNETTLNMIGALDKSSTYRCTVAGCEGESDAYVDVCPVCGAEGTMLNTEMAIEQIKANNLNKAEDALYLVLYLNNYLESTGGLEYYYNNFETIDAEVQSLKGPMKVLGADTTFLEALEGLDVAEGIDIVGKVTGVIELITEIDLTGPDENLNNAGLNHLLNAVGRYTNTVTGFNKLNYLAPYEGENEEENKDGNDPLPGGTLTLTQALTLTAPNTIQVTVKMTVADKFTNRVTYVTTPVVVTKGDPLGDAGIETIVNRVKEIAGDTSIITVLHDPKDDPKTPDVTEALYSEDGLRATLSAAGALNEDWVISYFWEEYHKCGAAGTVTTATCAEPSYCIYCKEKVGEEDTTDGGHLWDTGKVTTAATCTANGVMTYNCTRPGCSGGGTKTVTIVSPGHAWSDFVSNNDVTCHSRGTKTRTCATCGTSETVTDFDTALLPHDPGAYYKVDDATHAQRCKNDGCPYVYAAVSHVWDKEVTLPENEATCLKEGLKTLTCTACGASKDEVIPKKDHSYTSEKLVHNEGAGHLHLCVNGCNLPGGTPENHTYETFDSCDDELKCLDNCGYIKPAGTHILVWDEYDDTQHKGTCANTGCTDVWYEDHEYDAGNVTKAPTCTEPGILTQTCSVCGHKHETDIPATGHSYTSVVTAPTCEDEGYTTYTCPCGHSYVDEDSYVDALDHDWDDGVVTTEPTCTEKGVKTFTCKRDAKHTKTEPVDEAEHNYGSDEDWYVFRKATCEEPGEMRRNCINGCGAFETKDIPAIDCIYDEGVVTTEPTCTEKGVKTFTCTMCGDTYTEEVPATGHSYTSVVTPPTCDDDGYTTYTCTNVNPGETEPCGHSYQDDFVPATGHDWDEGVILEGHEATCTKEGTRTYTCRNDADHTYTETIEKIPHVQGDYDEDGWAYIRDGLNGHYKECGVCGNAYDSVVLHTYDFDNCTLDGTCQICGFAREAGQHSWGQWSKTDNEVHSRSCISCGVPNTGNHSPADEGVLTKPSDCQDEGERTHTCSVCGGEYTVVVPKVGHAYYDEEWALIIDPELNPDDRYPTCTVPGSGHYECIYGCGEIKRVEIPATDHDYDFVVTPPTCDDEGYTTYTCTCGDSYKADYVPATGHDDELNGVYDENGHELECSVCHRTITVDHDNWEKVPDDDRNVAATIFSAGKQVYKCACGKEKVVDVPELDPEKDYTVDYERGQDMVINLLDNQGYTNYQLDYTITLPNYGETPIEVKVSVTLEGNTNLTALVARANPTLFPGGVADTNLKTYMDGVYNNGDPLVNVTCKLIDRGENKLRDFVEELNGENDNPAISFSLVETSEGKYTIIANVSDAESVQGAIMDVAMALFMGENSYPAIGLKSHAALPEDNGYEYVKRSGEVSLQALINGLLYEDGFGTGTIVKLFTETGAINPDSIPEIDGAVIVPTEEGGEAVIGGYLQTAYMALGNATEIQYEVDFVLTMSQPAPALASARNALDQYSYLVSAETKDGKMQVSLKEKFYELYAAEMLATGVIDKNEAVQIYNEVVCAYLHEYLVVLMGDGVSHETYENTLGKVGYNADLNSYKTIINRAIQMFGDAKLSDDSESMILDLSFSGKNLLDGLMEDAGVAIESALLEIIKEYKDGADPIVIGMTAVVEPDEVEYVAAVIDPYYGTTVDKIDFVRADEAAVRINRLGGAGMVILLADITGDLTFNHTTILDLNGYTVTGNIVANGTLYIVDSVMGADEHGGVSGSVSGEGVSIVAGAYDTDVSDCLAGGYIQNGDGIVEHELYTLVADEDGNVSVLLNSDATSAILSGKTDVAIDIAADLILNYMDCATMTFDGKTIYLVDIADVLALLEGNASYRDALIQEALGSVEGISGETDNVGVKYAINAIIDDLLKFDAVADALESGEALAEYTITTKPLDIEPVYVGGEDYLSVKLGVDTERVGEEFTLSVLFVGDRSAEQADAFDELDKTTTADSQLNNLKVTYAGGAVNVTAGGTASVIMNLTDETRFEINGSQKNNAYLTVIALAVNAGGNNSLLEAVKTGTYTAQKAAFDDLTVKEVFDALKALNRGTTLEELLEAAQLEDAVDAEGVAVLSDAYHGLLVATGYVLDYLDITGDTRKMGALDTDGDGVYEYSKADVTRTISNRINAVVTAESASLTIALFGTVVKYNVTVTNGTGGGEYEPRAEVTIKANAPEEGYEFAGWTVVSGDVTLTDATATETTFAMPEGAVEVKAEFKIKTYTVTLQGNNNFFVNDVPYTEKMNFTVDHGSVFTVKVTAAQGYKIDYVIAEGAELTGPVNGVYTIESVTGDVTITVQTMKTQGGGGTVIPVMPAQNCCSNPACGRNECHSLDYTDLSAILEENPNIWWHEDDCYLDYVICRGLMIGVSETEFAPQMAMSRAMIVTAMYRQEGEPEVTGKPSDYYTDARDDVWYSDALVWATEEGIVLGYGNGLVGPNDILTREQLATLFYRYTAHKGKDVETSGSVTDIFSDADQISNWAADSMEWACSRGLLIGPGNNKLVPKGDIRRCEFAALLCRWIWGEYDA